MLELLSSAARIPLPSETMYSAISSNVFNDIIRSLLKVKASKQIRDGSSFPSMNSRKAPPPVERQ